MSIAMTSRRPVRDALPWAVMGLGLLLVVVNLALMARRGRPAAEPTAGGARGAAGLPHTVTLAAGKREHAGLAFEKAATVSLPTELGVPGRIEVNQDRQVQVRPRATGVVREVKVSLGQAVKAGQALAVLDSPDVGTARLHLRAMQRELATARAEADWKKEVSANVAELIPELRKRLDEQHDPRTGPASHSPTASLEREADVMEKQYADRRLGNFRATLMSAAVEFDIAAHEEEKTGGLRRANIIGEHPAFVAKHTREAAESKFRAVLEQTRFDAANQNRLATQAVRLAESNVIDAAQRLKILGVSEDIPALLSDAAGAASPAQAADEDVTAYTIAAPFDATVIMRSPLAVPSQKVEVNEVLFGLADLSTVWVMANIPESDFSSLPALQGGRIRLGATAYPGRDFAARVLSVGASVDPTTRTVSMLAVTPNPDGLLKLGMFVRIVVDTADGSRVLAVPSAAVVDVEGEKGVFAPDGRDGRTFAFRPLTLGRESGGRVAVLAGLNEGDMVVSRGAFVLKSELILQNQEDEE